MQLLKSNEIISELLQIEDFSSYENLQCWIKPQVNYNIHIFSIQLTDEKELLKIKDDLRDSLAIYFQSQTLEKGIERWNIYQVFFIEESVSKDIKQQVEQDKFATRKLVFDNLGCILNDEEIDKKINSEIFEFKLTKNESASDSLIDSLKQDDAKLFSEIEKANGNINILIKSLENE
jgi:hypothetical protein